ncbi:MAG TPA: nucleotide sugar dehydrogenase [bacterium]|nr:nucleotide sugar dehydrogenase [bacterium]
MKDLVISVVGLGKIGSPLLACFAACGYRAIGVDLNERSLALIRDGRAPVPEPHVKELFQTHRDRISVTADCVAAVVDSGMTFVAVPTPSERDGTYSLKHVLAVCDQIGDALRQKPEFHVVVVTSTVLPQDMETNVLPVLEKRSAKVCGREFGLCYSPEFVAIGSVVRDLQHPEFVLIGESDERSGSMLERVSRDLVGDSVPMVRMNFVNAELVKIAVNTFVTTRISYANMLAEVCEHIPGCDVDVVTSAMGRDSRIGSRYLKGRLGYGGPCFPRDNVAFSAMARRRGVEATLADATDAVNRRQVKRILDLIRPHVRPGEAVGVLGLTYTPNTDVVEESQGLQIAKAMVDEGFHVIVYDPLGMPNARGVLGPTVEYAPSAEECIRTAHLVVVATPWDEFKRLEPQQFERHPHRVVFDCWRILPAEDMGRVTDYVTIGQGRAPRLVTNPRR